MKKILLIQAGFFLTLFSMILIVCVMMTGGDEDDSGDGAYGDGGIIAVGGNFTQDVLDHQPMVEKYAKEYNVSEYMVYLLAIIQVESGGTVEDVMQSSESLGLPPNSLSTEESIEQGCKYFSSLVASIKNNDCDISTAVQAYNYGGAYVGYVAQRGKVHSFELAKEFAKEYSGGAQVKYNNPVAAERGYDWRYNYGNMFYVDLINSYLEFPAGGNGAGTGKFIWPLPAQYTRISSPFGWRNCPFHGPELHPGIDIPAPAGTEIYASKAGTVETATYHSSLGNYIVLDHGDGTKSQYNHTLKMLVKKGDSVGQGQVIAKVGSTGSSTGAHLDFRIFVNGVNVDPSEQIGK